jgi:uncharacterized protein
MAELEKQDMYACALAMPTPDQPICKQWVEEISRHIEVSTNDEVYLVGHSLGGPAILRYLESEQGKLVAGAVLVSAPARKTINRSIDDFLEEEFDFAAIRSLCREFSVIHGDNDPNVPLDNAEYLADKLGAELVVVEGGGHLNGSAGWFELPQCLVALHRMIGASLDTAL